MSINGIKRVTYGVDDVQASRTFFDDFGLPLREADTAYALYMLEGGSSVEVRHAEDPALPEPWADGPGIRETVFGVDSPEDLERFVEDLSRDRDVTFTDGTAHFRTECGIPLGLAVFQRRGVRYAPDPVNATDNVNRLNQHRRWRTHARPKVINHVAFRVHDPDTSWKFFEDRLHFRLSDVTRGLGVFGRADGMPEHHSVFLARTGGPGQSDSTGTHHVCFGVEDIDELMIGANHMQRRGWRSHHGLGRHRIASSLFYYLYAPCGGMVEYGTDTDYLDDSWIPREWNSNFGYATWFAQLPDFLSEEPAWDVDYIDNAIRRQE